MIKVKWLGWANFLVTANGKTIAFDPFFKSDQKADLILCSHAHPDHADKGAIEALRKEGTVVVASEEAAQGIPGAQVIKVGESQEVAGVKIEAVAAYNHNIPNHQKGKDTGFIVTLEGKRVYHAADTDFIEEMKDIKDIDLALLPIGGTYTMDVEQAIEAVKIIQPKVVIPMHYGKIEVMFQGEMHQVEFHPDTAKFKNEVESQTGAKVVILAQGEEYNLE